MTTSTVSSLEQTIHKTNAWIDELAQDMGREHQQAYAALRAVLHALRDRLTVTEASDLAAQLPMLVRGVYYESWNPAHTPTRDHDLQSFLERIASELEPGPPIDPEQAARSVFKLLSIHCTDGQVNHVRSNLPKELQTLWPQ